MNSSTVYTMATARTFEDVTSDGTRVFGPQDFPEARCRISTSIRAILQVDSKDKANVIRL
jgi:hypothetical protein